MKVHSLPTRIKYTKQESCHVSSWYIGRNSFYQLKLNLDTNKIILYNAKQECIDVAECSTLRKMKTLAKRLLITYGVKFYDEVRKGRKK
jgi:hypothetical protein